MIQHNLVLDKRNNEYGMDLEIFTKSVFFARHSAQVRKIRYVVFFQGYVVKKFPHVIPKTM